MLDKYQVEIFSWSAFKTWIYLKILYLHSQALFTCRSFKGEWGMTNKKDARETADNNMALKLVFWIKNSHQHKQRATLKIKFACALEARAWVVCCTPDQSHVSICPEWETFPLSIVLHFKHEVDIQSPCNAS